MAGSEIDYEALAERLSDEATPVRSAGTPLHGDDAAAAGREFLLREYGGEEAIEAEMRRGRPRLGSASSGPSPSVRGRLFDSDYAAFKALEERTGKSQSELVREGVHLLLVQNKLVKS